MNVLRMLGSASPPFFLTIVVVQNVPLLMTESSMVTGCDVSESDVTRSDVIIPKVVASLSLVENGDRTQIAY